MIPGPAGGLRVDPRVMPPRELWRGGSTPPWHQHRGAPGPYTRLESPGRGGSFDDRDRAWRTRCTTSTTTTVATTSSPSLLALPGEPCGVSFSPSWMLTSVNEWMTTLAPCSELAAIGWDLLLHLPGLSEGTTSTSSTTLSSTSSAPLPMILSLLEWVWDVYIYGGSAGPS